MDVFIPQAWKNAPRAEDKRRKILKRPCPRQTAVKHLYARFRKRKCRNRQEIRPSFTSVFSGRRRLFDNCT